MPCALATSEWTKHSGATQEEQRLRFVTVFSCVCVCVKHTVSKSNVWSNEKNYAEWSLVERFAAEVSFDNMTLRRGTRIIQNVSNYFTNRQSVKSQKTCILATPLRASQMHDGTAEIMARHRNSNYRQKPEYKATPSFPINKTENSENIRSRL